LRIAFTGAHGTGKTTLCNELASMLKGHDDVVISREVPRVIVDTVGDPEFFRRGNNSLERQLLIFFYQATEDRFLTLKSKYVLHDRTMVDHLAYTTTLFPEFRKREEYTALISAIRTWLSQYDFIVSAQRTAGAFPA